MRYRLHWIAWAVVGLSVSACTPAFDEAARQKVAAEATQVLMDYQAAICKDGLLAEFAFLDSTDDFHWLPPGAAAPMDYDSVARAIRQNAAALDTACVTYADLAVTATAPDSARYTATVQSFAVTHEGDTSMASLREQGVLVLKNGKWWLLSGNTTMMR